MNIEGVRANLVSQGMKVLFNPLRVRKSYTPKGSRQIIFKYLYGKILLNDMNLFLRQIVSFLDV